MLPRVPVRPCNATVLSLDPISTDHLALNEIISRSQWSMCPDGRLTLARSATAESAMQTIRENTIPVLVCGCDQTPDTWKQMLQALTSFANPPLLILTSRIADEHLWAEALNLGAYDVLAKPFDRGEVIRTLSLAWLQWHSRRDRVAMPLSLGARAAS